MPLIFKSWYNLDRRLIVDVYIYIYTFVLMKYLTRLRGIINEKTILTVGAVGLAVAGSAQTAKADETDLHTNEANEQQVQVKTQTTEQKEETAKKASQTTF